MWRSSLFCGSTAPTVTYQSLGEGLLRIGVGPNTEARVFSNSYALASVAGEHNDGLEDAKIGFKQRLWAGKAGSVFHGPDEQNADVLIGMAVGNGLLVVPAGRVLTAVGG